MPVIVHVVFFVLKTVEAPQLQHLDKVVDDESLQAQVLWLGEVWSWSYVSAFGGFWVLVFWMTYFLSLVIHLGLDGPLLMVPLGCGIVPPIFQ